MSSDVYKILSFAATAADVFSLFARDWGATGPRLKTNERVPSEEGVFQFRNDTIHTHTQM